MADDFSGTSYKVEGIADLEKVLLTMADDFGYKKIANTFIRKPLEYAMQPVLNQARSLAPHNTGILRSNIKLFVRRATDRDRRHRKGTRGMFYIAGVRAKDDAKKTKAQEFGTKNVQGQHFLTRALSNNAQPALQRLQSGMNQLLIRYQSKYTRKK